MSAPIQKILVDQRNIDQILPGLLERVLNDPFVGLDCETQDDGRHAGLNALMKVNEDSRRKAKNTRLIFDYRRTVMTGFSIYCEGDEAGYYFNLAHADLANRLDFEQVRCLFERKGFWLAHNAAYEITCFALCHGVALPNIICTMQMSVTAFGDDNYDEDAFNYLTLGAMEKWQRVLFVGSEASKEEAISKICAKESDADHSYNGFVDQISYGHGLKNLVKMFLGGTMATFDETMGDAGHMGQLTGEQVREYGVDDAYWVVPLFRKLMAHIAAHSPRALDTFFTQENPMTQVFSQLQIGGMRVYRENIEKRRETERATYAALLRELREALRQFEFEPTPPNADLLRKEKWYANGRDKYVGLWKWWISLDEEPDDFEEARRVSAAVPNAWADERKLAKGAFSIQHYMPQRVLLYDMLGLKIVYDQGKVQSDGECRGKILARETDERIQRVLVCLNAMASLDTRMKLYLTPYTYLADPETERL